MDRRLQLVMALLWAATIVVAAVMDAPSDLISILPVLAVVTLLPGNRRCGYAASR